MNKKKSIVLAMAIAAVFLVAAIGSASANGVCVWGNINNGEFYQCGQTVTQSCTLNATMTCSPGYGLIIGADDITINGAEYTIDGQSPGTCDDYNRAGISGTITSSTRDNVTIKNLKVKNFCSGMYFEAYGSGSKTTNLTIENCTIYDNGRNVSEVKSNGITTWFVYNSTINNCTIYNNTGGADCSPPCENGGSGIWMYAGNDNNITNNKIYDNKKGGFFTKAKPLRNNISHNEIWGNHQGGIILRCKCCANNTIEYNNASYNYGTGIFIGGPCNTIRYNTVCNNKNGSIEELPDTGHNGCGVNFGRSDSDIDCGYAPCGSIGSRYNNLSSNRICGNEYLDIWERAGVRNTNEGDNNICDKPDGWNDDGTTGCTYRCVYAYKKQHNAKPPSTNNVPSTEFSSTDYDNIRLDDNDRKTSETDTNGNYAIHRFNFTVTEPAAKIDKIKVIWNGIGKHDDDEDADQGAELYIYDFNSASYGDALASTDSGAEVTLTGEKDSDISHYISSSGNVTVLVEQKNDQFTYQSQTYKSHIETDYVQLRVEWS